MPLSALVTLCDILVKPYKTGRRRLRLEWTTLRLHSSSPSESSWLSFRALPQFMLRNVFGRFLFYAPTHPVSSMKQVAHMVHPLINSTPVRYSHFLSEGKMVLNGWMTVTRTRSAGIQRPPVVRTPARPMQKLLCTGRLSRAQVLAWRLFLCSWPAKIGLRFCGVHWKDSSWSLNVRTHFTALNHISFVAQHNSSNLCSCQFWHLIWFYQLCCPSTNRLVLLTWKWVFPSIKA